MYCATDAVIVVVLLTTQQSSEWLEYHRGGKTGTFKELNYLYHTMPDEYNSVIKDTYVSTLKTHIISSDNYSSSVPEMYTLAQQESNTDIFRYILYRCPTLVQQNVLSKHWLHVLTTAAELTSSSKKYSCCLDAISKSARRARSWTFTHSPRSIL